MSTVRVEVKPVIYQWVKNQINLDDLKVTLRKNFEEWCIGKKMPTFNQIQEFSNATRIPLGYFFLNEPPVEDEKLVEFRTIDSAELYKPSRDLLDTIHQMESIQDWMTDYLINHSNEPLDFVGSMDLSGSANETVLSIRKILDLPKVWFKKSKNTADSFNIVRKKLERAGIIVMMNGVVGENNNRKLDIDEFRAFTLINKYAPLIFINATDSNNGRLFSLFHELAHVWYGKQSLFNDNYCVHNQKKIESVCNEIAAELILPNDIFIKKWNDNPHQTIDERIALISKECRCGKTVVARRALDNHFITGDEYRRRVDLAKIIYQENRKNTSGGNYYTTKLSRIDNRVLFALNSSAYAGETSFTEVYHLTNTNRKTFDELIRLGEVK